MNKTDFILTAMNIFDENERLKNELEKIKSGDGVIYLPKELSKLEEHIVLEGEKQISKQALSSWSEVVAVRDGEGNISVTEYKEWIMKKLYRNNIPDVVSKTEFLEYFEDTFKKVYEEEKEKVVKELEVVEQC